MRHCTWLLALALGGFALANASTAQAGLIPAAVNIANDGANFRFTYSIQLPSDYTLKAGDYFTIYDFKGFVGATNAQPAGWTFGSAMTGVTPPHIAPVDDAGLANLTWTYHGANTVGPVMLGNFSADSIFGGSQSGDFTSKDQGTADGRTVGSITGTLVPEADLHRGAPEPISWALLALSLPVIGAWRLVRRNRRP